VEKDKNENGGKRKSETKIYGAEKKKQFAKKVHANCRMKNV